MKYLLSGVAASTHPLYTLFNIMHIDFRASFDSFSLVLLNVILSKILISIEHVNTPLPVSKPLNTC